MSFRSSSTSRQATGYLPPSSLPATLIEEARAACRAVLDTDPTMAVFPGTTDATWFHALQSLPTLPALGPASCAEPTPPTSGSRSRGVQRAVEIYTHLATSYCSGHHSSRARGDPSDDAGRHHRRARARLPAAAASPRGTSTSWRPPGATPGGRPATLMAEARVDGAVLVPLDAHDDYVAGALDDHPKTFAAIAVAKPAELRAGGARGESLRARRDRSITGREAPSGWVSPVGR